MITTTTAHNADGYWTLLKDLDDDVKLQLISRLSLSIVQKASEERAAKLSDFFGIWGDEDYMPADDIVREIKSSRSFKNRDRVLA